MEMNEKAAQKAAEIAAATEVEPVAAAAANAVPTEKTTIASRMDELAATNFTFCPPKSESSVRGSLVLLSEQGAPLEVWTCSKTVTAKLMAITTDVTLEENARKATAHQYAYSLVLMWNRPKRGRHADC